MPYSLDTAAAAERIIAAGADPAIARAIVTELALADGSGASKSDLDRLETALTARLERLEAAAKSDLDTLRVHLEAAIETSYAKLSAAISASERRGMLATLAIAGLLFAAFRFLA